MAAPRLWRLVPALGIAQIVSWGALYYAIGVLAASMRADLGISEPVLFGAYSLSLLLSGLFAPAAGRAIDRYGGRTVLCVGSVLGGLALAAIGLAHHVLAVYGAWCLAGIAMALTLYDPAFATLSQHTGRDYRKALTALTLLGGLASTMFWPLSLAGMSTIGWRETMLAFGAIEIFLCLPLHYFAIPAGVPALADERGTATSTHERPVPPPLTGKARKRAFVALAVALALNGFVVSALSVHLIAVLQGKHFAITDAVWIASCIGPMQVAGRVLEFTVGRRWSSRTVGTLSFACAAVAVVMLLILQGSTALALLYAVLYGASNGVLTIVRGMVPAELFGRVGFGRTLGSLVAPTLVARAIAPLACAGMAVAGGPVQAWLVTLAVLSVLAALAFVRAIGPSRATTSTA